MSLENKIQMLIKALEKNTDALLNASVSENPKPEVVVEEPEVVVEEPEVVVEEPEVVVEEPEPVAESKPSASIEDCRVIATYIIKVLKDKAALSEVLKKNGVTNLTAFSGDTDSFLKDLEDAAGVKLENCPN
jgi:hypothetical protein